MPYKDKERLREWTRKHYQACKARWETRCIDCGKKCCPSSKRCVHCTLLYRHGTYKYGKDFKKCTICKQYKHLSEFTKNKAKWDNLEAFCRECNTIRMRKWREKNRERVREIAYKSFALHRDRQRARGVANYYYEDAQECRIDGCCELGERHHPDYGNGKYIIWLCKKHHRMVHNRSGELLNLSIPASVL